MKGLRIITVRRISQVFFLGLFLWLCAVTILGDRWWQWGGWPVNLFLELDPLVAIGTLITTGTVYRGLLWALVTVVLTILLGRWFCGWLCPFGTLHQFIGYLGSRGLRIRARLARNATHPAQAIKYYLLLFFLGAAAWSLFQPSSPLFRATLQTGLLDPIPLLQRSVNLALGALADHAWRPAAAGARAYEGAWLIGAVCLTALGLNLLVPRFYCRFICPLGALLAVLGRFALWRIGKTESACTHCQRCAAACEGACDPLGQVRTAECVLCYNCTDACRDATLRYAPAPSAAGERPWPTVSRRGVLLALGGGLAAAPLARLDALTGANFRPAVLRPPGSLPEPDFLTRCIKCGQCMKICPSNIIQPAMLQAGIEGLWTPVLNYRIGSSGCSPNCVACGHICPTAAIRPLSFDEKAGRGAYADQGPVRLGLAFVDQGRCLPWAMGTPCIVCQEVCPVTPKAIRTRETWEPAPDGGFTVTGIHGETLIAAAPADWGVGRWATGDFWAVRDRDGRRWAIRENGLAALTLLPGGEMPAVGDAMHVAVHLQRPVVDPTLCVGCGICEHECPISGRRAIRVTAENESRHPERSITV